MKKCPYCGKKYSNEVERCLIDNEILIEESVPAIDPASVLKTVAPVSLTEREIRIFEVVLVCLIAFGGGFLTSTYSFLNLNNNSVSSGVTAFSWVVQTFREISALGLVWYVLLRRGKSFYNLGLNWQVKDFSWSIFLKIAETMAYFAVFYAIYYTGLTSSNYHATHEQIGHHLFGGGIFVSTIIFQFVNPFFEELIVRAYLMTEIKALTGSVNKAILASTLLQASYHLYQGAPAALGHGAAFLIFSIFYAKTNRIAPIILAHLYSDVGSTLLYWIKHH